MTMSPPLRRLALTAHITFSVGWIGTVVAYLALGIAATTSDETRVVRAAWTGMELIGWYVIVPLALSSLATGLVMALGTRWGLFQHYWVLFSLVLTAVATGVLLVHMPTVSATAALAQRAEGPALEALGGDLFHPGIGLVVLLGVQLLNVYKPRGMTRHGTARRRPGGRSRRARRPSPRSRPAFPGAAGSYALSRPRLGFRPPRHHFRSSPVKRFLVPLILGAAALLLVAGCGGGASHNDQDVTFAREMVPHHQQAVEMADLAATRASDPKVNALAARIKGAQDPEIRAMQGWLADWDATASDMSGMDHGGGGKARGGMGMMSDADMGALRSASGTAFDRMFLTMMIDHHSGAIEMAKTEQAMGRFQPAKDLARSIQDTQAAEIVEMQQLTAGLPAS